MTGVSYGLDNWNNMTDEQKFPSPLEVIGISNRRFLGQHFEMKTLPSPLEVNGGSYMNIWEVSDLKSLFPSLFKVNGGSYGLTQNLKSGITGFRTLPR